MTTISSTASSQLPSQAHMELQEAPFDIREALEYFYPKHTSQLEIDELKAGCAYRITDRAGLEPEVRVMTKAYPSWNEARREREIRIAEHAGQSGVTPRVLAYSPDFKFKLIEYFDGQALQPQGPLDLQEAAQTLSRLHSVGIPPILQSSEGIAESTALQRFYHQFQQVLDKYEEVPAGLVNLRMALENFQTALELVHTDRTLCHLDLHCDNLLQQDGHLRIVDFGMMGPDHPLMDVATFAMYMGLNETQERELVAHYNGSPLSDEQWKDYLCFRPLAYLSKIMWPLLKQAYAGNANSQELIQVWQEEESMPLQECFDWIYSGYERTPKDDFRFAKAAFDECERKYGEFMAFLEATSLEASGDSLLEIPSSQS